MAFLRKLIFGLATLLVALVGVTAHAEDLLDPEVAFKFSAKMRSERVAEVRFAIADGYYLYRERLKVESEDGKLGEVIYPKGKVKFDETFQKEVETYRHEVVLQVAVLSDGPFTLKVRSQGCADAGLCYPPMDSLVKLEARPLPKVAGETKTDALPPADVQKTLPKVMEKSRSTTMRDVADTTAAAAAVVASDAKADADATPVQPETTVVPNAEARSISAASPVENEQGRIGNALRSGNLLLIAPLFMLLGLGLSFTPCVLPMVPILSFIIVGEGAHVRRSRGFVLSLSYAMGMALVYTALGVTAGLLGEGLAASLQNPYVLSAFALLMVLLSLSMFNVYQLQVPASWQTRLSVASESQRKGKLFGVFAMGAISALIVGPCVAAPLAGALVYISQTRDVLVGGSALFSMALGMSVPLLLVGISAGGLLPRAGRWMEGIKRFFGVLMLAMALWMVTPVLSATVQMIGWAILFLVYGVYLWTTHATVLVRVIALALMIVGGVEGVGVATGGRDAFAPLAHFTGKATHGFEFRRVRNAQELEQALAQNKGKLAMLDFYADWCVSCKEMEKLTFVDEKVQAKLGGMLLLQIDVTANNADDKAMLKRFGLFGPPGILFFDSQGQEIVGKRVIGYQDAEKFLQSVPGQ